MSRSNRKGNAALSGLKARLRELPRTMADSIAKRVAPDLTGAAVESYDIGRTVYGEARPKGVDGRALDLVESGKTKARVHFKSEGRIVRAVLNTRWAKYLIGKYRILPNGPLPVDWKRHIDHVVHTEKTVLK